MSSLPPLLWAYVITAPTHCSTAHRQKLRATVISDPGREWLAHAGRCLGLGLQGSAWTFLACLKARPGYCTAPDGHAMCRTGDGPWILESHIDHNRTCVTAACAVAMLCPFCGGPSAALLLMWLLYGRSHLAHVVVKLRWAVHQLSLLAHCAGLSLRRTHLTKRLPAPSDHMQNQQFLKDLKFGIGDGELNYYLFNYRIAKPLVPSEVGLILM